MCGKHLPHLNLLYNIIYAIYHTYKPVFVILTSHTAPSASLADYFDTPLQSWSASPSTGMIRFNTETNKNTKITNINNKKGQ